MPAAPDPLPQYFTPTVSDETGEFPPLADLPAPEPVSLSSEFGRAMYALNQFGVILPARVFEVPDPPSCYDEIPPPEPALDYNDDLSRLGRVEFPVWVERILVFAVGVVVGFAAVILFGAT